MIQCEIIGDIVRRRPGTQNDGGNVFVTFFVACTESVRDADGRRVKGRAIFRVTFKDSPVAGRLAEGMRVFVRGRIGYMKIRRDGTVMASLVASEVWLCSKTARTEPAEYDGGTAGFSPKTEEEKKTPDPDAPADRPAIERLRRFFGGK